MFVCLRLVVGVNCHNPPFFYIVFAHFSTEISRLNLSREAGESHAHSDECWEYYDLKWRYCGLKWRHWTRTAKSFRDRNSIIGIESVSFVPDMFDEYFEIAIYVSFSWLLLLLHFVIYLWAIFLSIWNDDCTYPCNFF